MEDAILAEQLREWALLLEAGRVSGVIAGMKATADELSPPLTRVRRRINIVRYWFEDAEYVERQQAPNPIKAWLQQVKDEFNVCGINHPDGDGASVIDLDGCVSVTQHEDGNATLKVNAWLDFKYDPDEVDCPVSDADVATIQRVFYDWGGVAGDFVLLPDSEKEE